MLKSRAQRLLASNAFRSFHLEHHCRRGSSSGLCRVDYHQPLRHSRNQPGARVTGRSGILLNVAATPLMPRLRQTLR